MKEGIDAVIVDSVLAIRKGLTNHTGKDGVEEGTTQEVKDTEKLRIDEGQDVRPHVSAA